MGNLENRPQNILVHTKGPVAYRLALPEEFSRVHDTFLVSMLCKYLLNLSHVLETPKIKFTDDLTYEEQPVKIVDKKEKVLCDKTILNFKVMW